MEMTFAKAAEMAHVASKLEALEAADKLSPAEAEALQKYRDNYEDIVKELVETKAGYSGFKSEAVINLDDEIYGAYKAATDFLKNGDLQSAKEAYARHRDFVRKKHEMFEYAAPEAYAKGRAAGAGTTMGIGLGGMQGLNLMRNASTMRQMLTGMGTGAALASAPEFGEGEGGFMNRVRNVGYLNPAIGGVAGGAAPVAGRTAEGIKNIYQNIRRGSQDGFQGQALRRVAKTVDNSEQSGIKVKEYLDSLGEEGMLADVPGGTQGLASGLAATQGRGSNVLRRNIIQRSDDAGARISKAMEEFVDQPNAGYLARKANEQNKNEVISPMYEKAKASTETFDVQDLREAILEASTDASARTKKAMNTLLKDLGEEGDLSARKLHNIRVELNDTIQKAFRKGDGGKGLNLKVFLDKIDGKLDNIDGYAAARAAWSDAGDIEEALDMGMDIFSGGPKSAMSPVMLEAMLEKMTDAQREAFKAGARDYIGALMGTSRNDAAAAWQAFGKNWNAEKLEMIIGKKNAQEVTRRLMAEAKFSKTKSDTIDNSLTEFRRDAKKTIGDLTDEASGDTPGVFTRTKKFVFDTPINNLIDEILYSNTRGNLNEQVGKILTLQGRERDQVVSTLLDEAARMKDRTLVDKILNALFSTAAGTTAIQKYTGKE